MIEPPDILLITDKLELLDHGERFYSWYGYILFVLRDGVSGMTMTLQLGR